MLLNAPKSLYSRFLLIIIVPIILIQIITAYIFYERHWDSLSRNMINSLTGEVDLITNIVRTSFENNDEDYNKIFKNYSGLSVTVEKNSELNMFKNVNERYSKLTKTLKSKTSLPFGIFKEQNDRSRISLQLGEHVVNINFSEKRIFNQSTYIFIIWMVCSSILLTIIAIIFLRNQVRSIISLSRAAENFGKGQEIIDFKPQGASEIRRAGIAFIEMKERIKRLIHNRTQMLAGVSHDLKTPLTRMKLITSLIKDKSNKDQLEQEVDEMNKMIEGYLNFAQLENSEKIQEPIQNINLNKMLQDIKQSYRNFDNKIDIHINENIYLNLRPEYFKRCITNIIDNAIKYASSLKILSKENEKDIEIVFEDDGKGIPEDKLEEVFQPFYRLEESRNSETGGVGLGLSITRDIINRHGGTIKLENISEVGLRVVIKLPK